MFELRKDISMPNRYYRAGERKSKQEWEALFPGAFNFSNNEWFIDLGKEKEIIVIEMPQQIVRNIFKSMHLHSMSYKAAAVKCCLAYGNYLKHHEGKS